MNYLAIIRKADFIDLFKYGTLNVYNAVDFDGNVGAHANDDDLFGRLTKHTNLFEYSFEYLILHFTCANNDSPLRIEIENVVGLYTFDDDAKIEMSISFDPRIKLQVSPWSEKIKNWHLKQQISQSKRGVDNLWKILGLPNEDRRNCEAIITEDIVSEVFKELFSNERPKGEQSIWTYLLRYERHSFYPKDIRGYLDDYIHVVCNWMKKEEQQDDVAETTGIYSKIMGCSKCTSFQPFLEIVSASKLPSLTDEDAGCKFAIVAFWFLLMKDKFKDGFVAEAKHDFDEAKGYGFEYSVAVYLLGLTLGYDKTYDAYYDSINLPVFSLPDSKCKVPVCEGQLFPTDNEGKLPIDVYRKEDYQLVYTEQDRSRLKKEGYERVSRLIGKAKAYVESKGSLPSVKANRAKRKSKKIGNGKVEEMPSLPFNECPQTT